MSALGIADTGLIIAYLSPRDQYHAWAVEQWERFPSLLTCEAVITEATHLAGAPMPVVALLESGALEIGYSVRGDEANVAALMAKYADQPMDFADACVVRMTEQHRRCEVLTVDGDFLVYRRRGEQAIDVVRP
jgi:predicted nucleic acid-binding protein